MASGVLQMVQHGPGIERRFRPVVNRHHSDKKSRRIGARHDTLHAKILKDVVTTICQDLIECLRNLAAKLTGFAVIWPIVKAKPTALPAPGPSPRGRMQRTLIALANLGEETTTFLLR
jgi:hypothetical protein